MKIYAATGHRPDKLGGYGSLAESRLRRLAKTFLLEDRPDRVIGGMALGWDMAWIEAAIGLGIPCTAAVPFLGQELQWPRQSQVRYQGILEQCDEVFIVSQGIYSPYKMQLRNEWMVDESTKLVSLWNGSSGGTANCVQYAEEVGRECVNLWERFQSPEFQNDPYSLKG